MNRTRQLRNTYGGYVPRHMAIDVESAEREASAGMIAAREQERADCQRIHHPAIAAPSHKCYRVIRRYTVNGSLRIEDIGAFRTEGNALSMSLHEIGNAIVVDPNNRTVSNNGQLIEARNA